MFKPLSWNEIRMRAVRFAREWRGEHVEQQDKQPFLIEFFNVFGINRKQVAQFESRVRMVSGKQDLGFIDLLYPGKILIEMKTTGKDLGDAYKQALDYYESLDADAQTEIILTSDFANFDLYDMTNNAKRVSFALKDFPKHVKLFAHIAGYQNAEITSETPVNIKAAENMGRLHDALKEAGYTGHKLEVYLVRLLFCLFADDTGIFEENQFLNYIKLRTAEDGSDLGETINSIFDVLNKPENARMTSMDELLKRFPYINGGLFAEQLETAFFDSRMRKILIKCCEFDWSRISPEIFGAMFQSVMNQDERHDFGAHYTEKENILKVIEPLFLNDLKQEFSNICSLRDKRDRKKALLKFHDKLANLTFFDPACGCGNFLIVTYQEIRKLELQVLLELHPSAAFFDIAQICKVKIDQFFGIELLDFPAQVAHVSLWLTDHLCNREVGDNFGQVFQRIPLTDFRNIHCGNALTVDWRDIIPADKPCYIISNPPFLGARVMEAEQKQDVKNLFNGTKNFGELDYVCCWYKKAAEIMRSRSDVKTALVSTNSITQGEQVAILWKALFRHYHISIDFAYRTFRWSNKARAKAQVHCVIIGFSTTPAKIKFIFDEQGNPKIAQNISPYLTDTPTIFIENRTKPLCDVPEIGIGNKPIDDGNYLFTDEEKDIFLQIEPNAERYFKRWYGSREFINNGSRWCLWLGDCSPAELRQMPECMRRVENVRQFRLNSKSEGTRDIADTPTRFHVENMPEGDYIVLPEVSSEKRFYMPMGFMDDSVLCSNLLRLMPHATLYHFGVLESRVHMAWMRAVCGRLKSDYRYSKDIVYNNFPWCNPTAEQRAEIERTAQAILDARALYRDCSLADLYDNTVMPHELRKAHAENDEAVLCAYDMAKDISEVEIVENLFKRYSNLKRAVARRRVRRAKRARKTPMAK